MLGMTSLAAAAAAKDIEAGAGADPQHPACHDDVRALQSSPQSRLLAYSSSVLDFQ